MTKYSFLAILTCMLCFFCINGCEKTQLHQSPTVTDTQQVLPRSTCEEWPGEDECCCGVWLNSDQEAFLRFCGTSDGNDLCSGADYCGSTFGGGGQYIDLHYINNPRKIFCMNEGDPFWVRNYSSTDVADIYITCQHDLISPQIIPIHLGPGDVLYFSADGSCYITSCSPSP